MNIWVSKCSKSFKLKKKHINGVIAGDLNEKKSNEEKKKGTDLVKINTPLSKQ